MLAVIAKHVKEVSVLRRLLFCAAQLNPEVPNFWTLVVQFALDGKQGTIGPDIAAALVKNLEKIDPKALIDDESLQRDLVCWHSDEQKQGQPLGIILISKERNCVACGSQLLLRKDRPSYIAVYDTHFGPLQGTHYHKKCTRCSLTQLPYYWRRKFTGGV